MTGNTLFLRLEGPMRSWGTEQSKFVIRRTADAPTKSGVLGMLCAALGVSRKEVANNWLQTLGTLRMAVRIDMPGIRWWDYHTVGAGMMMRISEGVGKTRFGPLVTRREYLCDASFLVILQGEHGLITELETAINNPEWHAWMQSTIFACFANLRLRPFSISPIGGQAVMKPRTISVLCVGYVMTP